MGERPYHQRGNKVPDMSGFFRKQCHRDDAIVKGKPTQPLLSLWVSGKIITFYMDTGATVSLLRKEDGFAGGR